MDEILDLKTEKNKLQASVEELKEAKENQIKELEERALRLSELQTEE